MDPSKAFKTRYATARKWRSLVRPTIEEIWKFCAPDRVNDFTNAMKRHEVENFHSLPEELASDLGSDLVSYFTPAEAMWANYSVVSPVPEDQADTVEDIVSQREKDLFNLIGTSNYNDIAPQWGFEAATHGTPALWVTQSSLYGGIYCEPVPPHELLICLGHRGILDRFREKHVLAGHLEAELEGNEVDLTSEKLQRLMNDKPETPVLVCYGFWLDWKDPARPMWTMEITVDGKRVTDEEVIIGDIAGPCPLLVGRFNPQPGRPWGRGAGWKALADMRTLDKVEDIVLSAMEDTLKDTIIYPDDGFIDMSEGLQRGRAYPANRGFTRDRIYEFPRSPAPDAGYFQNAQMEDRLRVAFYQDGPRQTGDTPPTATQWADERRRVQARIGKPSAPLWTELFIPLIQRFEYLGVEIGRMKEALSHAESDIQVIPVSPLQKAQNADKVLITRSNLDLLASIAGEQSGEVVDLLATFKKITEASGDELMEFTNGQATPPAEQ